MRRYLLLRIAQSLVALLAISIITFGLSHLSGSPVDSMLPDDAGPEEAERLTPNGAGSADSRPILHVSRERATGQSGRLAEVARLHGPGSGHGAVAGDHSARGVSRSLISTIIAIPIGVLAGVYKDTPFDSAGKLVALLGQAMPNFWLGIVLIWIFAVELGWFPTSGRGGFSHMVLPAIAMGWFQVAALMRLTRSAMLEVLDSEYIKLARIKGVPEWRVIWVHALRNAAIAPLTYFGVIAGVILTGSVVIETVFAWPGTGQLAIEAIRGRDYPVVQAVVLTFASVFILANLIVDTLYAYVDPRIRYG